jgi:hypothetical protein
MECKKSKTLKRCKRRRMRGGNDEFDEGPLDTTVHKYLQTEDLNKHVKSMNLKKKSLEEKWNKYKNEYDKEAERLEQERRLKDKRYQKNLEKEELQRQYDDMVEKHISEASTKMLGNVITSAGNTTGYVIHNFASFIEQVIVASFHTLLVTGKTAGYGIDRFFTVSGFAISTIGKFTGSIMQTAGTWFFKFFFQLIFAIGFFVLIIFLIIYGVSIFTNPQSSSESSSDGGSSGGINAGCSSILTDGLNINVAGLRNLFNVDKIQEAVERNKQQLLKHKPTFDMIPDYDFTVGNFIQNPFEFMNSLFDIVKNNPMIKNSVRSVTSTIASTQDSVGKFTGNASTAELSDRSKLESGRANNMLLVDINMIRNKSILAEQIRTANDKIITSSIPKNIEWLMPEKSDMDYKKLPPSLLQHNIFEDKNIISIPWKIVNNEYVISCSDAYFSSNMNRLANILKDESDGKTCSFVQHTPIFTTNTKERCASSTNMGSLS